MHSHSIEGLHPNGRVFLVTHGQKEAGADPGMTPEGFEQIKSLIHHLPDNATLWCVCGTGKRHIDVAKALGLDARINEFSPIAGTPDSLAEKNQIILASGITFPIANYNSIGIKEAGLVLLNSVPADTVICAGRALLEYLGFPNPKSAAVYCFTSGGVAFLSA